MNFHPIGSLDAVTTRTEYFNFKVCLVPGMRHYRTTDIVAVDGVTSRGDSKTSASRLGEVVLQRAHAEFHVSRKQKVTNQATHPTVGQSAPETHF